MPVKGGYLLIAGGGAILIWSGLKGKSWSGVLRDLISGKNPSTGAQVNPITGVPQVVNTPAPGSSVPGASPGSTANQVSTGSAQSILQQTAAQFGWTGAQWQCLYNVEMAEAGFNPQARNSSSGAYGLAQALGHGVSGGAGADGTNEYGGYGLSTAQAQQANNGSPGPQALWMCNYIQAVYGNPCAAWAHEQSNHWY